MRIECSTAAGRPSPARAALLRSQVTIVRPCVRLSMCVQAHQSVVVVDGSWTFLATQSKFFLAVIASTFGDCYPIIMLSCVAGVMLLQLSLAGVTYSSVLTINALRIAGLLCGT